MNRFKVVSTLLRAAGHNAEAAYYDVLVYHAHSPFETMTKEQYGKLLGVSSPRIYQLHKKLEEYSLVHRGEGKDRRIIYVSDVPDHSLLQKLPGWAEYEESILKKTKPTPIVNLLPGNAVELDPGALSTSNFCGTVGCPECGEHLANRVVGHFLACEDTPKYYKTGLSELALGTPDSYAAANSVLIHSVEISTSIFDPELALKFSPDFSVDFDSPNVNHYGVRVYGFGTDLASRAPACAQLNYSNTNKYKVYTNVYTSYLLLSTRKTETIRSYYVFTLTYRNDGMGSGLATPTEKEKKRIVWKKQPKEANSMAFKWRRAEDLPEDTEYFETVKSIVDTWNATLGSEPLRLTGANYALVRRMLKEAGVSADTVRRAIAALPGDKYWANQPNRFVRIFNNPSAVQNLGNAEHDRFGIHSARARDFFSDEEQPYVQADAPSEEELWADFDKQYKLR